MLTEALAQGVRLSLVQLRRDSRRMVGIERVGRWTWRVATYVQDCDM